MLKMYQRAAHHGGTSEYWDETWNNADFEQALRFCEIDPLRQLFERFAPRGSRMLEGGCGPGYYVSYYGQQGVKPVGLDFAFNPLARLRRRDSAARLCAGDVGSLPFRDGAFDVYYSGGVVEHFEAGCAGALREARRVLRPGGILLISVPYFSPLRRMLTLIRREWKTVAGPASEPGPDGEHVFFQYAYTRREFERQLRDAGLRIRSVVPYSIVWGLSEMPVMSRLIKAATSRRGAAAGGSPAAPASTPNGHPPSMLKRLIVGEDRSVPIAGTVVEVFGWLFANMLMFVCVPDETPEPRAGFH